MRRWTLLACGLCLLGTASCALAQERSVSYSTWTVAADMVTLKFILPAREAQRLVGAGVPVLTSQRLGDYLLSHVSVRAAGHACPAIDQGYDIGRVDPLAVGNDYYGFEIVFRCESTADLVLTDAAIFERVPSHVDFARVEFGGRVSEQLLTRDQPHVLLGMQGGLPSVGVGRYLQLGAGHVLHNPDRLCFLLALLLLWRRRQDAVAGLVGLACGYGVAFTLSATTVALPRTNLLEACFGLMIGVLAFAIVVRQVERPRVTVLAAPALLLVVALVAVLQHLPSAAVMLSGAALCAGCFLALVASSRGEPYVQLLPAAVLGFLDGFILPLMQLPMRLPKPVQLPMLIGFDLGAWLAAAIFMLLVAGAFLTLRGRTALLARGPLNEVAGACLAALGSFWLLTRLQM